MMRSSIPSTAATAFIPERKPHPGGWLWGEMFKLRNVVLVLLVAQTTSIVLLMRYSRTVVRPLDAGAPALPKQSRRALRVTCLRVAAAPVLTRRPDVPRERGGLSGRGGETAVLPVHGGTRRWRLPRLRRAPPERGSQPAWRDAQMCRASARVHRPRESALRRALQPRPTHLPDHVPDKDAFHGRLLEDDAGPPPRPLPVARPLPPLPRHGSRLRLVRATPRPPPSPRNAPRHPRRAAFCSAPPQPHRGPPPAPRSRPQEGGAASCTGRRWQAAPRLCSGEPDLGGTSAAPRRHLGCTSALFAAPRLSNCTPAAPRLLHLAHRGRRGCSGGGLISRPREQVLGAAVLSSLSSVYFERMLKKPARSAMADRAGLWLRNVQLGAQPRACGSTTAMPLLHDCHAPPPRLPCPHRRLPCPHRRVSPHRPL